MVTSPVPSSGGSGQEAGHLQKAVLARALVSPGWTPWFTAGCMWAHVTESWHGTHNTAALRSCDFVIITGCSAIIKHCPKKPAKVSTLQRKVIICPAVPQQSSSSREAPVLASWQLGKSLLSHAP